MIRALYCICWCTSTSPLVWTNLSSLLDSIAVPATPSDHPTAYGLGVRIRASTIWYIFTRHVSSALRSHQLRVNQARYLKTQSASELPWKTCQIPATQLLDSSTSLSRKAYRWRRHWIHAIASEIPIFFQRPNLLYHQRNKNPKKDLQSENNMKRQPYRAQIFILLPWAVFQTAKSPRSAEVGKNFMQG